MDYIYDATCFGGYTIDHFAAVAGGMHCVGLVESATVDADTEISTGGIGEACIGPHEKEACGTRNEGCQTEGYGQGLQELVGGGNAQYFDEWLGCREMEYAVWVGQDGKEWEDGSQAEDFGE